MEKHNNIPIKHTGCCDPFDPAPWENKKIVWDKELFVKDHVTSIFHIPLNMGKKVLKNMALIEKAGAVKKPALMLSDEKSLWGTNIYINVSTHVPDAEMTTLSGTFLAKVFEGPYKEMGNWSKEMKRYVESKNETISQLYFCYTSCPGCAKAYGKNYVILFAKIS